MSDDYTLYKDDWNEFIRRGIESFYNMEVRNGELAHVDDGRYFAAKQIPAQGSAGQGRQAIGGDGE